MALPRMTGLAPLGLPAMDPPIPKESCYADDSCTEPVYDDLKSTNHQSRILYVAITICTYFIFEDKNNVELS